MEFKTYTFKKKDGSKVGIEAKSLKTAQKLAKDKYGIGGSKAKDKTNDEEE